MATAPSKATYSFTESLDFVKLLRSVGMEELFACADSLSFQDWKCFSFLRSEVKSAIARNSYTVACFMLDLVWERLNTGHWCSVDLGWRQLFTLLSVVKVKAVLEWIVKRSMHVEEERMALLKDAVKMCDVALVMGAPILDNFCGKMAHFISTGLAKPEQTDVAEPDPKRTRVDEAVPAGCSRLKSLPVEADLSFEDFLQDFKLKGKPVLIREAIKNSWAALDPSSDRFWSVGYFAKVMGLRTVPVEVGSRYTDDSWTQTLMTVESFIQNFILGDRSSKTKGYLAQHNLFDQIEELKEDFEIPEYCLASDDGEDVSVNFWFGPTNTVSPLHTDPKNNCFCQVFGRKYVRLYPADQTAFLYPYENGILSNTSRIDLDENEDDILKKYPDFEKAWGYEVVVEEGDILFIPPSCWHFVKSLSTSCSLSFWFK